MKIKNVYNLTKEAFIVVVEALTDEQEHLKKLLSEKWPNKEFLIISES